MDALAFLLGLFGDAPSQASEIVVFSKASESRWCASCESAARATVDLSERNDVYFGVALQNWDANEALSREAVAKDPSKKLATRSTSRGRAESTTAIGALWLDVDWAVAGAHRKKNLPAYGEEAYELIAALPAQPTIIIETGGGLHAWWFFTEPWVFKDAADRAAAAALARGWQALAMIEAKKRGWSLDATHDLARVLRLPGTKNHKYGTTVVVASHEPARTYNPSDFDVWMPNDDSAASQAGLSDTAVRALVPVIAGGLTLNPLAEPPFRKLMLQIEQDARFEKTWKRKRNDLPSQSEHDMAIASALIETGWNDQEIVDTLIAHRRDGGGAPKLRADYYGGLLAKLRAQERLVAQDNDSAGDSGSRPANEDAHPPKQTRAQMLDEVSAALGVKVLGVVKQLGEPPRYRVRVEGGDCDLGDAEAFLTSRRFRRALIESADVLIDPIKPAKWTPIARVLLKLAEIHDLGDYSSNARMVRSWIASYVAHRHVAESVEAGLRGKMPFDGPNDSTYIRLQDFTLWLHTLGERPSSREVARWLRQAGCSPSTVSYDRVTGERTTAYAWRIPAELNSENALLEGG